MLSAVSERWLAGYRIDAFLTCHKPSASCCSSCFNCEFSLLTCSENHTLQHGSMPLVVQPPKTTHRKTEQPKKGEAHKATFHEWTWPRLSPPLLCATPGQSASAGSSKKSARLMPTASNRPPKNETEKRSRETEKRKTVKNGPINPKESVSKHQPAQKRPTKTVKSPPTHKRRFPHKPKPPFFRVSAPRVSAESPRTANRLLQVPHAVLLRGQALPDPRLRRFVWGRRFSWDAGKSLK